MLEELILLRIRLRIIFVWLHWDKNDVSSELESCYEQYYMFISVTNLV